MDALGEAAERVTPKKQKARDDALKAAARRSTDAPLETVLPCA